MVSLNIYKNSANKFGRKTGFKIEKWNWRSRPTNPKINRNLNPGILHLWPEFGDPSLNRWWVIVPTSSRWVTFDFEVKFDLEGQGQSPPKTIGILTMVFYTYGPNLVILAWMGDELSCEQTSDYRTHGRTDGPTHRQTQATTIPKGQNWPRVKMLKQINWCKLALS